MDIEFEFKLSKPLAYSSNGHEQETDFVLLKAPTAYERKECRKVFQMFLRATRNFNDQVPDDADTGQAQQMAVEDIPIEAILGVIGASDVDLDEFLSTIEKILVKTNGSRALIGGETPMTQVYLGRLNMADQNDMCLSYFRNFILRSQSRNRMSS